MRFCSSAILLMLLSTALVGCKKTPKQQLQGKWVGERVENFDSAQAQRASGWASGASFEFRGARVTVTIPAETPRSGTFKIAKADQNQLLLTFLRPHGAQDRVAFQLDGDKRMRWMLGDGRSILLRKVD